jgi:arsenite oxidase small subunit
MKKERVASEPLWREEFAIETAEESYVDRRQFSKFLVLTSLGMFVGNLWILLRSWYAGTPVFSPLTVGSVNEIPVGGVKLFSYPTPEDPCIMIRTATDRYAAYSQKCTHLSCAVYYEKEANRLECPCHEGYFSVEDGSVLQGPPPRRLPRVILEQDGANLIATRIEI